jgi:hypothetical protein
VSLSVSPIKYPPPQIPTHHTDKSKHKRYLNAIARPTLDMPDRADNVLPDDKADNESTAYVTALFD